MPRIKFTHTGANSLIGGFASGDVMVCGEPLARHLVEEAGCAQYIQAPAVKPAGAEPAAEPEAPAKRVRRARAKGHEA